MLHVSKHRFPSPIFVTGGMNFRGSQDKRRYPARIMPADRSDVLKEEDILSRIGIAIFPPLPPKKNNEGSKLQRRRGIVIASLYTSTEAEIALTFITLYSISREKLYTLSLRVAS